MAIFRVIFRFSGYFNLWRLSPKNNPKRFLGWGSGAQSTRGSGFSKHVFFVKCVSGVAKVPYQVSPSKNAQKQVQRRMPGTTLVLKVLVVKRFPGCDHGRYSPVPLKGALIMYLVSGAKPRLSGRHVWKIPSFSKSLHA